MSDTEDVLAIQQYLARTHPQVSAAVRACRSLDDATRAQWYALAGVIVPYVSETPAVLDASGQLARGRQLRDALNAYMALLKTKGCGDVAKRAASAPPAERAPAPGPGDPHGSYEKNGLLSWVEDEPLGALFLALVAWAVLKNR